MITRKESSISKQPEHTRINEEIRYPEVRVIGANGEQLGIMSSREAQILARQQGVDLVEIAANANPPVVKVIDWGKFQYQRMKEQARNRKKAREKQSELKMIKIGLKIGENDLKIKLRKIREFLLDGDRVRIMIIFRGRELAHKDLGYEMMDRVIDALQADPDLNVVVEGKPNFAGRNLAVGIRNK